MIKPNWNTFGAKFSENLENSFEWFCYLLFCEMFERPSGIFRYINQSGIETDPIINGQDVIGWQAKYFTSSLSNHKREIISSLEKARRDYPEITKSNLLF